MHLRLLSRHLGRAATALAFTAVTSVVLVAGAGAAGPSAAASANAGGNANAAAHRSDVATAVLAAVAAGTNPSNAATTAAKEQNDSKADAGDNGNSSATVAAHANVTLSRGQPTNETSTSGARPGWGCGDTQHNHSGPPGRPDATPPRGCSR